MKIRTSHLLFLLSGFLLLTPYAYYYFIHKLAADTMLQGIAEGREWDRFNVSPLPELLVPATVLVGVASLIGGFVILAKERTKLVEDESNTFQTLDLG